MKKESRGIVLSQKNQIVSIIDEHYGRICAYTFKSLFIGGFYLYNITHSNMLHLICKEEIHNIPLDIARCDIIFLHNLFEITLQNVPLGSCVKDIFLLFSWLYNQEVSFFSKKNKKYVLFRLLSLLEIWPIKQTTGTLLLNISQIPIDRVNKETLDLIPDGILDEWLNASFFNQELYKKLKTKVFLESIGFTHDE